MKTRVVQRKKTLLNVTCCFLFRVEVRSGEEVCRDDLGHLHWSELGTHGVLTVLRPDFTDVVTLVTSHMITGPVLLDSGIQY